MSAARAARAARAAASRIGRRNARGRGARIAWSIVALIVALIWVFPVYWMVDSSFLSGILLNQVTPHFLPIPGTASNYAAVVADGTFFRALGVSLAVTLVAVAGCLAFAFLGAIAVSRFRFRGRTSFVVAMLIVQMLPAEGLFIAQYKMVSSVGGLDNVLSVSVIYIAFVVPFTIWMLRGFVAGVPIELEEAAMVDGLSRTQAFLRVTLPLLAPGLVASGVYAFLQAWNEFTVALVLLPSGAMHTLPLWLRGFVQVSATHDIDWGQVMAASTLVAVPVIVFFIIVQGRLTSGLVAGAVKG